MTCLLIATLVSQGTDGLLRRSLTVGETTEYRLEIKSQQKIEERGQILENKTTITSLDMSLTLREKKAEDRAKVQFVIRNIRILVPGEPAPTGEVPIMIFDASLDSKGEVSEIDLTSVAPKDQPMLGGVLATLSQAPIFPETPVKKGDKWSRTIPPSPMFGNKELALSFRFAGDRAHESVTYSAIDMDDKLPITLDLGSIGASQGSTKMEGTLARKGSALYDASGRLVKLDSSFTHDFIVKSGNRMIKGSRAETTALDLLRMAIP